MQKRIIKHLASIAITMTSINAYAVLPGLYLGVMGGPAINSGGSQNVQTDSIPPSIGSVSPKSTQFGTRLYLGYKINQYAGIESGFTYYSQAKYKMPDDTSACGSAKASVKSLDVVGRGSLPLSSFEVFGKAGVAVVYETTSGPLNPNLQQTCGKSNNAVGYRPTVSAGVAYNLSQAAVVDLTWTRTQVGGVLNSYDFYAIGISYHFVDIYCGQFLCD